MGWPTIQVCLGLSWFENGKSHALRNNSVLSNPGWLVAAMVWICMSSQNSYVEILMPSVTVLESGAFGKRLGHEGRALMNGISAL